MADIEIEVTVTLDSGNVTSKKTTLSNVDESKDWVIESEVVGMASPPPIIRPAKPRPF